MVRAERRLDCDRKKNLRFASRQIYAGRGRMSNKVIIITPELPPAVGGVADYTQRLVEAWPAKGHLQVLVPKNAIEELLPGAGRLLVQYSAYGFDHHGYPGKLI